MGTGKWQVYLQILCSKGLGCATEEEDNTKTRTDGLLEQTTDKLLVTMGTLKKFLTEFWPGHRPFAKQEE
jgi:hypothetical protein